MVCVDIGFALELEKREGIFLVNGKRRKKSITSLNAWKELDMMFIDYLNLKNNIERYPYTIKTIKTLLFIKQNYPDITDLGFLTGNLFMLTKLSLSFDFHEPASTYNQEYLAAGELRLTKRIRTLAEHPSSEDESEHVPVPDRDFDVAPPSYEETLSSRGELCGIFGMFAHSSFKSSYKPLNPPTTRPEFSPTLADLR